MLGGSVLKRAGQLVLAALQYAQNQQSFIHYVFQSTFLSFVSCADGLFASTEW
jgi:hypothetical protein